MIAHRYCGHHLSDSQWYCRSHEEVEEVKQNCPIKKMREVLLEKGILKEDDETTLIDQIDKEFEKAVKFAEAT